MRLMEQDGDEPWSTSGDRGDVCRELDGGCCGRGGVEQRARRRHSASSVRATKRYNRIRRRMVEPKSAAPMSAHYVLEAGGGEEHARARICGGLTRSEQFSFFSAKQFVKRG